MAMSLNCSAASLGMWPFSRAASSYAMQTCGFPNASKRWPPWECRISAISASDAALNRARRSHRRRLRKQNRHSANAASANSPPAAQPRNGDLSSTALCGQKADDKSEAHVAGTRTEVPLVVFVCLSSIPLRSSFRLSA